MLSGKNKSCPQCGQIFRTDINFCPNDGARLSEEGKQYETHSLEKTVKVVDQAPSKESNSLVGEILDGQYEILSLIGKGGMSVVYKARHLMLRKIVAIKTLLPHLVLHPHSLQRFQQEAQAASNIVHTNVVTIHNFGITPEGQPYLVMDYLEGLSLQTLIEEKGHLSIERAVKIFIQVANALGKAHEMGVIHRDLKPSNIILIEQGEKQDIVQLVDFGIAKLLPREGNESVSLTQTGEVFGSPLYMSPEQCRGEKLDARSDIYSMGCLMYETLCGRPPHTGDNTLEVLYKHINQVPVQISSTDKKLANNFKLLKKPEAEESSNTRDEDVRIPTALETIVFKALAKTPDSRYQSMQDLERDLESFQKSQQFSFLSVLKSRWELFRLKREPHSKAERMTIVAFVILSLLAILGCALPLINFWNLAESPAAKQRLIWEDLRKSIQKKADTTDLMVTPTMLQEADEFLERNEGDGTEIYTSLIHAGKRLGEFGMWEEAARIFDKAARISIITNGSISYPTMFVRLELADAYYNGGKMAEAEKEYAMLAEALKKEERNLLQYTMVISRLGHCYYEQEKYREAEICYQQSITCWRSNVTTNLTSVGKALDYGLIGVSQLSQAANVFSRFAEIKQMEGDGTFTSPSAADLGKDAVYKIAAGCNYRVLPIWRATVGPDGKNTAICELHLAEILTKLPDITFEERKAPAEDTPELKKDDTNPEKLFENAERTLKSAYGAAHPYYAIALLKHADYKLKCQNDWKGYIEMRLKACSILNNIKDDSH